MNDADKIKQLRAEMKAHGIEAFIIPRTDEYQAEFLAPYAERVKWLTKFSGSAGLAIVAVDKAVVMSDARYTIQLKQQVDHNIYETADIKEVKPWDWLEEGTVLGYDPHLHTLAQIEEWKKNGLKPKPVPNLIDPIWADQPARPAGKVELFPVSCAGRTHQEKIVEIAASVAQEGADAALLTQLDSIAWLLNIRGSDMDYIPAPHAVALLDAKGGHVHLFMEPGKLTEELEGVTLHTPQELPEVLAEFKGQNVALDYATAPSVHKDAIEAAGAIALDVHDPCTLPKAIKTPEEIASIRKAHIVDGVAMVQFMKWFGEEAPSGTLHEADVAAEINIFRSKQKGFRGLSFATIAGFAENGAIVHYNGGNNRIIDGDNLLLLDSGGQYLDPKEGIAGTTDITRTLAVGNVPQEMKEHFTTVLKGHIAVANARVPVGTTGAEMDEKARQPLLDAKIGDPECGYAHGTGHGVGCYLQVHEDAAGFSPRKARISVVEPGMFISNEPGLYEEGSHGIRIESLVLAVDGGIDPATGKPMIAFETLTVAPLDRSLIIESMLTPDEKAWLDAYQEHVLKTLSPHLDEAHQKWLAEYVGFKPAHSPKLALGTPNAP